MWQAKAYIHTYTVLIDLIESLKDFTDTVLFISRRSKRNTSASNRMVAHLLALKEERALRWASVPGRVKLTIQIMLLYVMKFNLNDNIP